MNGKIAIIGAGFVGSSAAYAIALSGIASEMVLIDVAKEKAKGEAMDINHGLQFMKDIKIRSGDMDEVKGADIVVMTAGLARKPGETRLDLVKKNTDLLRGSILPELKKYYDGSVVLAVANPVDVLAYFIQKDLGIPTGRLISSGTNLDTMRLRFRLSELLNISTKSINAYILGEHGDSSFTAWSSASISGMKLDGYVKSLDYTFDDAAKDQIIQEVRAGGSDVIKAKGATYYAIAVSIATVCRAILFDEKAVFPLGTMMEGMYGVKDVVISLPSVVGKNGVEKVLDIGLTDAEVAAFKQSAQVLIDTIKDVEG